MTRQKRRPIRRTEHVPNFAQRLWAWHRQHGRHALPWQQPRTPYRVWLSEIMLQQTQVATVIPYFNRFVDALPSVDALADAHPDEVMALWSGLGYYSRARNLHRAAQLCLDRHGGELPDDFDALLALPGIGRSTAGAILAQAYGRAFAILDGNVKRVLCRSHGVEGYPGVSTVQRELWRIAESLLPEEDLPAYTQAIMDLGALVCTRARPDCPRCPLSGDCVALAQDRVRELPSPRPAKALPERECHWLMLVDEDDRVLLERRPPVGIWGGLWSLPEFPDAAALRAAPALHRHGLPPNTVALAPVRHVFSHYAVTATPVRCRAKTASTVADGDRERWFSRDELANIGLPQPVRRLLTAGEWTSDVVP